MKEHDECPVCGRQKLRLIPRTTRFEYMGLITDIQRDVLECTICDNYFFQDKDDEELDNILTKIREGIDEKTKI